MERYGSAILLFVLAACSGPAVRPEDPRAAITPAEIQDHVVYLASDSLGGRRAGTAECDVAAEYVAHAFRQAGVLPAGAGGTFYQEFEVPVGIEMGDETRLSIKRGGVRVAAALDEDFVPFGFSASAETRGALVFAGYGITAEDPPYDDYAGLDADGKIVVVLRYEPRKDDSPFGGGHPSRHSDLRFKATNARDHGAAGILLVTGPNHDPEDDELLSLRGGGGHGDVGIPAVHVRRAWVEAILRSADQDLRALQTAIDADLAPHSFIIEGVEIDLAVDIRRPRRPTRNVIGWIPGSDPDLKDQAILIGAHYDHLGLGGEGSPARNLAGKVHNGADDNASGTSGLMELAEAFALAPEPPLRTLIFVAFSAEEEGLLGSAHYVKHPVVPLEKTIAMVNFDMIGRAQGRKVFVDGAKTGEGLKSIVEAANEGIDLNLVFRGQMLGASDHVSFVTREIPFLFFNTGAHSDYHRPSDDADKIDSKTAAEIVRLAYRCVRALDRLEVGPIFVEPPPPPAPPEGEVGGFRAYLGTVPDFSEVEGGVRLADVTKGSPGDLAGIRGGDILTRLGDREVRNLYDFTYALRENKPGQEIEVQVLRDGKTVTLKATLGSRGKR